MTTDNKTMPDPALNENSVQKNITDVRGFLAWGAYTGVKSKRRDLALIYSKVPATVAGVFTQNVIAAEPIRISRKAVEDGRAQVFVVNSGNANACTGEQGRKGAEAMVNAASEALDIDPGLVVIASTGIIGQKFPTEKVVKGIHRTASKLSNRRLAGTLAANAILTTDTFAKQSYTHFNLGGKRVNMAGIAKGSGMIHPNMATMLGFIVSDAAISPSLLNEALHEAVDDSFNMITVDGDTSTNDMVGVMCNGLADNDEITTKGPDYEVFLEQLKSHCIELARQIVSDGEGATKLIRYDVDGAPSREAARRIARTVSDSSLVKTAFFGRDPNWGRIIAAAGRAGVEFDPDNVDLWLSTSKTSVQLLESSQPVPNVRRKAKSMMRASFLEVRIDLNQGDATATAWGADFSYEYVRINAEYST